MSIGARIADALAHAHGEDLLHGDVAPANILYRGQDPVLVDWGSARRCPPAHELAGCDAGEGTPGYIAPERLRGHAFDSRADVYSLGCVLYELMTGRHVFASDDISALARCHLSLTPDPPSRHAGWIPAALDELLLAMLEKDPARRLPYAQQAAIRLSRWANEKRPAPLRIPVVRPRLVEREELVEAVLHTLAAGDQQTLDVTLLESSPGSGVSRMAGEIAALAARSGFEVVLVSPNPQAKNPVAAFEPLIQRACEILERPGDPAADLSELAALAPYDDRLQRALETAGFGAVAQLPRTPERVQRALVECMKLAASSAPLCIVVDALDTLGEFARSFITSLCASAGASTRCRLYVATRDARPLYAATKQLRAIPLAPLTVRGVAALLEALFANLLDASAIAGEVHRLTAGSPHRVVQFAIRMLAERAVSLDDDAVRFGVDAAGCASIAANWEQLPLPLGDEARQVGALAATLGAYIDTKLLSEACDAVGFSQQASELGLRQLVAERIFVPEARGYRFGDDGYRCACLAGVDTTLRQRYHRALARCLARRPYSQRSQREIALHCEAGGDVQRAARLFSIAARRADTALAIGEAIDSLQRAFDLWTASTPLHGSARGWRLGLRWLELLSRAARHDEVFKIGNRLLDMIDAAAVRQRARVIQLIAQSQRQTGDYASCSATLALAEAVIPAPGSDRRTNRVWIETQLLGVFLAYVQRDLRALRRGLARLARPVRAWGTPEQRATYSMWRANYLVLQTRYVYSETAVRLERHALRILSRADSRSHEAVMCRFDLAFMLLLGGVEECQEACRVLSYAEQLAQHGGDAVLMTRILTYRAIAQRRLREPMDCERYARRAVEKAIACRLRGYAGAALGCLAWHALRRSDRRRAAELCDEAERYFEARGDSRWPYPFQWLSLFPRLELEIDAERLEATRPILRALCAQDQARLSPAIEAAVLELDATWEKLDDGDIARRLVAIVRLATQHRYL